MWDKIQSLKDELRRINAVFLNKECKEVGYRAEYAKGIKEEINGLRCQLRAQPPTFMERYKKEWEERITSILPANHRFCHWNGLTPITTLGAIRLDAEWRFLYYYGLITVGGYFILSADYIQYKEGITQHSVVFAAPRSFFHRRRYLYSCGKIGLLSASKNGYNRFMTHLYQVTMSYK